MPDQKASTLQTLSMPNLAKPDKTGGMAATAPPGAPAWMSAGQATRYGKDFAERIQVPGHYARRPRLKDPSFFGVSNRSCEAMRMTRAPKHGASDSSVGEDELQAGVRNTAAKIEKVDLFFNWNGSFCRMTNDQNRRLNRVILNHGTDKKVKKALKLSVNERDDITTRFGTKYNVVQKCAAERSDSPEGKSVNRRARHLYQYVSGRDLPKEDNS